jgi:hypothetical protein
LSERETAILVPVPWAETTLGDVRRSTIESARRGIPARITLIYPFAPPERRERALEDLRVFFAGVAPFVYSLASTARFAQRGEHAPDEAVLYLAPEPSAPFVDLIQGLQRRHPEHPAYGESQDSIVPHVSIAYSSDPAVLEAFEKRIVGELPVAVNATEAWLMAEDEDRIWRLVEAFTFGAQA